jgi:hypothetical protein
VRASSLQVVVLTLRSAPQLPPPMRQGKVNACLESLSVDA